jgi:hypothetical protein
VSRCQKNYGFCSDPNRSIQKNFNKALKNAPSPLYLQPKNLTFHNLCKDNKLPPGTRQLLGLNLKFCLSSSNISNNINKTVLQMARSIRTSYYLEQQGMHSEVNYEKQIYVKLRNWHPPPAPIETEDKITSFEKQLKEKQLKLQEKHKKNNLINLTPIQLNLMKQLKANNNVIVKPTDKNLGPAIMDTKLYIEQVLNQHLLTDTYKQLSKEEANNKYELLKCSLKELVSQSQHNLSKQEMTYFQRSLLLCCRLPIFYGLPKVHKTPITLQPVMGSCGNFLSIFSNWLDYKMKE